MSCDAISPVHVVCMSFRNVLVNQSGDYRYGQVFGCWRNFSWDIGHTPECLQLLKCPPTLSCSKVHHSKLKHSDSYITIKRVLLYFLIIRYIIVGHHLTKSHTHSFMDLNRLLFLKFLCFEKKLTSNWKVKVKENKRSKNNYEKKMDQRVLRFKRKYSHSLCLYTLGVLDMDHHHNYHHLW